MVRFWTILGDIWRVRSGRTGLVLVVLILALALLGPLLAAAIRTRSAFESRNRAVTAATVSAGNSAASERLTSKRGNSGSAALAADA